MAWVVGCDEGAGPGARRESPSSAVLLVVVVGAERVEPVEACVVGGGPRFPVVDLDSGSGAPFDAASGRLPEQGDALRCGGAAAGMGDVGDIDAAGDDELHDALAEELAGDACGDGADTGDLARLVALGRPAGECVEVDAQQREVPAVGAGLAGLVVRVFCEREEAVERVGVVGIWLPASAGVARIWSMSGSRAARMRAPASGVPRAWRFHAPSASVNILRRRSRLMRR
ncbi:MAG: hypothetical protein M5T61_13725 [Acidimicrobiia bacterium]|nr:hypothetical protein [Acidimicrobiia bacterium]